MTEMDYRVDQAATAACQLRKSLLNLPLSPEGQDTSRVLHQRIIDFQLTLGEIRDLVELETV